MRASGVTPDMVAKWLEDQDDLLEVTSTSCAKHFNIARESLWRILKEEDVSFSEMLNEERRLRLSSSKCDTAEELADITGLSNRKSFAVWYKKQYGRCFGDDKENGTIGVL